MKKQTPCWSTLQFCLHIANYLMHSSCSSPQTQMCCAQGPEDAFLNQWCNRGPWNYSRQVCMHCILTEGETPLSWDGIYQTYNFPNVCLSVCLSECLSVCLSETAFLLSGWSNWSEIASPIAYEHTWHNCEARLSLSQIICCILAFLWCIYIYLAYSIFCDHTC